MEITILLLIALLLASLWTVLTVRLIRAVVGLAVTSAVLSMIMFRLDAGLAAVFELSVCAGLISVIFVITVSFTQRLTPEQLSFRLKERVVKYGYLPVIILIAAALLYVFTRPALLGGRQPMPEMEVRSLLWNARNLDLLGQVAALLSAAMGVVVLFKERR